MAVEHTYYVAHADRVFGERADDAMLADLLRSTWRDGAREGGATPTIVDGVSAWIDDAGAVQVRLVRGATAIVFADVARVDAIGERLRS